MRVSPLGWTIWFLCVVGCFVLRAQTNAAANPQPLNPQVARELSFLTPAQQLQYAEAHQKALEHNPGLKSEGETLIKQAVVLTNQSPSADKQAFLEKMNSHRQKLRAAMLKEDPTLSPIFKEIDQHISELRAQAAAAQNPAGTTSPPPAGH